MFGTISTWMIQNSARSNEPVTLRKYVTKYKHKQKWMVKFLVSIKLPELTQFASPKLSVYYNFVRCWGLLWYKGRFSMHSPVVEKTIHQLILYQKHQQILPQSISWSFLCSSSWSSLICISWFFLRASAYSLSAGSAIISHSISWSFLSSISWSFLPALLILPPSISWSFLPASADPSSEHQLIRPPSISWPHSILRSCTHQFFSSTCVWLRSQWCHNLRSCLLVSSCRKKIVKSLPNGHRQALRVN